MPPMEVAYANLLNAFRRAYASGNEPLQGRLDAAISLWRELWPDAVASFESKFSHGEPRQPLPAAADRQGSPDA